MAAAKDKGIAAATSTPMSSSTTSTSSASSSSHAASSSLISGHEGRQEETYPPPPPPTPSLHVDEEGEEDAVKSGSTEPPDLTQPFTDEEEVELAEWYRANPIFYDRILRSYKETVKKKRIMDQRVAAMEPPRTGMLPWQ